MLPETNKKQALTATLVHITTSWLWFLALEQDISGKLMLSQLPNWVWSIVHVLSQISKYLQIIQLGSESRIHNVFFNSSTQDTNSGMYNFVTLHLHT